MIPKRSNHKLKRDLIITLADKKYLTAAKQLFSSVYHKASWDGDYMLLARNIPEKDLKFFRDKGIFIKKCKGLYNKKIGKSKIGPYGLCKFYMFSMDFKHWKNIVYLDADTMVRSSLKALTGIKGFAAVKSVLLLKDQFAGINNINESKSKLYRELEHEMRMLGPSFNSGVMSFNTDIIKKETFKELVDLFFKYKEIQLYADQPTLNLYFSNRWTNLPMIYNLRPYRVIDQTWIKADKLKAIVLHTKTGIIEYKGPNYFYDEWMENLVKFEKIDLSRRKSVFEWKSHQIFYYLMYIKIRQILFGPINKMLDLLNRLIKYNKMLSIR